MSVRKVMLPVLCLWALSGCSTPQPPAPIPVLQPPLSPPAALMTPPRPFHCLILSPCSPRTSAPGATTPTS